MAKTGKMRNGKGDTGHKAFYQQPWVQRVLQGNYSAFAKLLFIRVASFGAPGCWMKNENLKAEFGRSESTIQQAITKLWWGNEFWITGWDSTKRKIYAVQNPEVRVSVEERYKAELKAGHVNNKNDYYLKIKSREHPTPNISSGLDMKNPVENHGVIESTP